MHNMHMMAAQEILTTWQSMTQADSDYVLGKTYTAIHSSLFDAESATHDIEWKLAGNQPLLSNNRLQDADVEILCKVLEKHKSQVHKLDLSYNYLTHLSVSYLSPYIKDPSCSLSHLNLSYTDIGAEGVEALAAALQLNKSVTNLQLNGCKIGRKGGIAVASMLQINVRIHTLGLRSADLDTDSVIAMATVLQANRTLTKVDLSRPLIYTVQEEPTIHLSRMLRVNYTLQELHLATFGMTDTGIEWICRGLHENNGLRTLNVSSNKLSRDGAGHFAALLRENPLLQELDLSHNRIEDEGLVWLTKALSNNTNLSRLNVCHNSIGDTGLCALADALDTNYTLRQITIWGNRLGEPTCLAFYKLLQCKRLLAVNIDVEPYMVDGISYLAQTTIPR